MRWFTRAGRLRLEKIDLSALPAAQREAEVASPADREAAALCTIWNRSPAFALRCCAWARREHVLILMMHHIICDWSSEGIIWRELSALYRSLINGQPAVLPRLAITHGDYAAWQQQADCQCGLRRGPCLLGRKAARCARAPRGSRGSGPADGHVLQGGRLRWKLNGALTEKLRRTSQQEKVSLFTIFAAAFNTLLYRYTGSEDILLGIPLADRDQPGVAVGDRVPAAHARAAHQDSPGSMSFRELLGSVQKGALELYAHRAAPFDQIVRKLGQERSPGHTPLFQVMLNWRDRDQQLSFIGMDGLAVESLMAHSNTSKFDLLLFATDEGDEIWLEMEYNADLFDEDRVARMLGHYRRCWNRRRPIRPRR